MRAHSSWIIYKRLLWDIFYARQFKTERHDIIIEYQSILQHFNHISRILSFGSTFKKRIAFMNLVADLLIGEIRIISLPTHWITRVGVIIFTFGDIIVDVGR